MVLHLLHAIVLSKLLDRVAMMTAIEHDLGLGVFQQFHADDVVHGSRVCCTFVLDGREDVHLYHILDIIVVIVAVQLGRRTAVCVVPVVPRAIRIRELIHTCLDYLDQRVATVQPVNMNGISSVIGPRRVAL